MSYRPTATKSKSIILRSSEATHRIDQSSAVFVLDSKLLIPPNTHALISLQSATIPLTMLMVNSNTNTLILNNTTYLLDYGNYNATTMFTQLQSKLSGYTVTYSTARNIFAITHASVPFTISGASTCLFMLGFSTNGAHTSTPSLFYASDQSADLSGVSAFNVRIMNITTNTYHSNQKGEKIIARIPVTENQLDGGLMQYTPGFPIRMLISDYVIDHFHVMVQSETHPGAEVDFRGVPWTIHLLIEVVHTPTNPKHSSMLQGEKIFRNLIAQQQTNDIRTSSDKQKSTKNRAVSRESG